jgi:hypothetical protein
VTLGIKGDEPLDDGEAGILGLITDGRQRPGESKNSLVVFSRV